MITAILTGIFGLLFCLSLIVLVIGFIISCCEGVGWFVLIPLILVILSGLVLWEIKYSHSYEIKIIKKEWSEATCEK